MAIIPNSLQNMVDRAVIDAELEEIKAEITEDLANATKESKQTQDNVDCGICIGLQMALDTIEKYIREGRS